MRYTALHCLPKPGRILHASHWRCEQKNLRPLESIAETQSQLQPGLLRLSAMISQYFIGKSRASRVQTIVTSFFSPNDLL
jgi:hypothetical protein